MSHHSETLAHITRRRVVQAAALATVGAPAWVGAQSDNWRIGQTAALSGPLAYPFIEANKGIAAAFKEVNDKGGIDGRLVELFSLDDGGSPQKAAANTQQLVEKDRVFCMFACGGTTSVIGALKVIMPAKVPLIAPATGWDALRAFNPLVFHTRASYSQELNKIARQLSSTGFTKIAIPYYDNAFGKASVEAFSAAAKTYKNTDWKAFLLEDTPEGTARGIEEIVAFQPTALMSLAIGTQTIAFYKALRKRIQAVGFSLSLVGSRAGLTPLGDAAIGITVSQVVPHPRFSALPVVHAYQKALEKAGGSEPGYQSLEGYVSARILLEALRRTGRNGNREKLIDAMHSMHPYDMGGYEVSFSPTNHNGSDFVDLSYFNGQKFRR